jgi:hypothetical protein
MEKNAAIFFKVCARATVLRAGSWGSSAVDQRTIFLPSNVPSLWRIDTVVWRESYQTVVQRFVLESKPEIPAPVFFAPSGLKKVKSDCKNFPSWIMYCLHLPFVTIGFPSFGKTSSPGPNRRRIGRAAFDRSPGHLAARTDCGFAVRQPRWQ